jgi:2,3-bisphosphoglycerate-independent phosphoglycerate mutase
MVAVPPLVLCILDGFGVAEASASNAVTLAHTPCLDELYRNCPHSIIRTSGIDVGLPDGQMGNSEVGHMNIGSGRIILQDLPKINQAIATNQIITKPEFIDFVSKLQKAEGCCHLLGMFSSGGVHSHMDHIIYLARLLAEQGIKTYLHLFADGRDNMPGQFLADVNSLLSVIQDQPLVTIATISGRYYAMDRNQRYDRVERCYQAVMSADALRHKDAITAIEDSYAHGVWDEFIVPIAIGDYAGVQDGDGLFMANFRSDRVRQLLASLLVPEFTEFPRGHCPQLSASLGMVSYSASLDKYIPAIFAAEKISNSLGEVMAAHNLKQLRIAETEKYAHVTFFFNAGREEVFPGEERILIKSPHVATYDLTPAMSAFELTEALVAAINSVQYALLVVNFANCDMVGHSGDLNATILAVEVIDQCLAKIIQALELTNGYMLITADHGNAEMMQDPLSKQPYTAHSTNPVPLIIYGVESKVLASGRLCDIAPTILQIMNLPQPIEMTGSSLLR